MKLSRRSYMQPTPKNLRKLGDSLLGVSAFLAAWTIHDHPSIAMVALFVGVIGKFLTNFFENDK